MTARDCLPCTAPELAAVLGITLHCANARLQNLARKGAAVTPTFGSGLTGGNRG